MIQDHPSSHQEQLSMPTQKTQADILVVDDKPDNIRLLATMLAEQGYKVRKSLNGSMALTAAFTRPPDLILLDINMPQMDGYEVCRHLKANETTRQIPVIFLSALDEPLDKVRAFEVGGTDYITKPFQLEEVLVRLENQLTIQRQKKQLTQQNTALQQEIFERQQTEQILYQSRALLASVLNSSLDGVAAMQAVRDQDGAIEDFEWLVTNPVAARLVGRAAERLLGQKILRDKPEYLKVIFGEQSQDLFDWFVQVVETGNVQEREFVCDREDAKRWFQIVAVKLGDGFAVTFRDITERKKIVFALEEANRELQRLANLDGLTQVANRRQFDERLHLEWQRMQETKVPLTLILCDVDFFKPYNDTYGHQAGDDCLRAIAQALKQSATRPDDLVARYGGEEFAIILPKTDEAGGIRVAKAIQEEMSRLAMDHSASTISLSVTLSLGISSACSSHPLHLPHLLVAAADQALYDAKKQGRNTFCLKNPSLSSET